MSSHAMATTDMRGPDLLTDTALGHAGGLRCGFGPQSHRQGPSPAGQVSPHPFYPFRRNHSPALLTISHKDICHAR
jgi:hypothetical protein